MENRNQLHVRHVPEDIVTDILLRLSAKSLLRFRTVSKLWLSLISHPQFIKSHYLVAAHKKPACILTNRTWTFTPKDIKYICLPQLFRSPYRLFIGSCNGIVCLSNYSGREIHLWNPSTKQYKTVPEPENYPDLYGSRCIGFGYDSISDDYKILCLQSGEGNDDDRERLQLFSTNSGVWTEIVVNIKLPRRRCINGPAINGILYFEFVDDDSYPPYELISFNLHNQEFDKAPLPCRYGKISNLFEFEGSLAIITRNHSIVHGPDARTPALNVWKLENIGDISWIKKFTFELPCQVWFGDELLIAQYLGNGQLYAVLYSQSMSPGYNDNHTHVWYNYKTMEGNNFRVQHGQRPLVLKYTESLVSLQGFESTEQIEKRYSKNSSTKGDSKQGYQAQSPTNWAPLDQQQPHVYDYVQAEEPIYDYVQAGAYTGQTQQYGISQSQCPGYRTQPTSGGSYASSWDQTFATAQQTTQEGVYSYYSQEWGHPQPQPGYNQTHGYSSTPGYGNTANQTPMMNVLLNLQGQDYTHDAYGYYNAYFPQSGYALPQQGYPSPNLPSYSVPSHSQAAYGTQPSSGYGPIDRAPQARKNAAAPPAYGQSSIPQVGYVQPGYRLLSHAGYCQPDSGTQRTPSTVYGTVPASGYAPPPQPYGAAAAASVSQPSYWGQQRPCNISYGSGYFQPPVHSASSIAAPTSQTSPPNAASEAPQS